jgi:pre-mRNA-splicing factor ATP-dependent RNA helicase DHX15/PRP43
LLTFSGLFWSYLDKHDKNWAWTNYLSLRALQQADNVRAQLQRTMERFEVDLVSLSDEAKLYVKIRQALVCGFFMQIAHKEGEKGNYLTVKDHQVRFSIFDALVYDLTTRILFLLSQGCRSASILWTG